MKKTSLLKIILLLLIIVSCNSKESKIKNAENLINESQMNFQKYDQKDWDKADTLITSLEKDIEQNRENYSAVQVENANKVIGRYRAIRIKNELNGFKNSMEDVGQQLKGAMEVLSDSTISN